MSTTLETDKPVTTSGWKKASTHHVLCPSGVRVGIRIPDLAALVESGQLPQHLLDAALGTAGGNGESEVPSIELVKQEREFTDFMVLATVVEPKLTDADLKDIPYEDKEFLVSVATRRRDLDAEGEHIGGLNKSEKFRRFRRLAEFGEDVSGL